MSCSPRQLRRLLTGFLVVAGAFALPACGASPDAGRPDEAASLLLDAAPNAIHSGIYFAKDRDFTGAEGVTLSLQTPAKGTNAVTELLGGRTTFAIMDLHDLAVARASGRELVAVMAIVENPLAAVLTQADIHRPRELEGHHVQVGGRPSDSLFLQAIVAADGGAPSKLGLVRDGTDGVSTLLAGKAAGATGFWATDGVRLKARRPQDNVFRIDRFGAPDYPELVLVTTAATVDDDPAVVRALVTALQRGYRASIADPDVAVETLLEAVPGAGRAVTATELDAVQSSFQATDGRVGTLDTAELQRWAAWEKRAGFVKQVPNVAEMFDPSFAIEGAKKAAEDSGN